MDSHLLTLPDSLYYCMKGPLYAHTYFPTKTNASDTKGTGNSVIQSRVVEDGKMANPQVADLDEIRKEIRAISSG